MYLVSIALAALVALATAEDPPTLASLVKEMKPCAVACYSSAVLDSQCHPGDFGCVCGNPQSLIVKMGICVGKACDCPKSGCTEEDHKGTDSNALLSGICGKFHSGPPSSQVAEASKVIVSEISSVSATATSHATISSSTNFAAVVTDAAAAGWMGVAAMAALAL